MKYKQIVQIALLFAAFFSFLPLHSSAETIASRDSLRHEIRIGWGDQMFETLVWREHGRPDVLPEEMEQTRNEHYRYTQHWFAEYQYRINSWCSVGGLLDGSGVLWDKVTRTGSGQELSRMKNEHFYNLILMPTVRFTYLHTEYISLHSALGIGLDINDGSEADAFGRKTLLAPAFQFTAFGVEVGHEHWFGAFEINGMHALRNMNNVYQLGSKLLTLSVGYRF